ncbi:carbohydrate ABC transporter substrate-binding protein, CUT1 family [Bradyrhizobium sp. Rc3b]|uniref:extracellular solute-binding protein n=1 Tax=Bradyrhizobium sp. Rc3b TaxID=1855322 RepID=UPI0008E9FE6F|nr:extracellular solute-binding protein [Bradyrhizobium sp. Rc3b]SFM49772.1 carbohydrate ABC transporter substrate-binding protein, CUT1 family [Bradyrhizobium sp. Rc3b]
MNEGELLRVIGFLDRLHEPFDELFPVAQQDPTWAIATSLVTAQLRGEILTVSALAQVSSVPHATALRRINELIASGWIIRLPRTRTGKSFTLHPGEPMMAAFTGYARHIKSVLAQTVGVRSSAESDEDFSFGVNRIDTFLAPPPSIMRRTIDSGRTLRFLLQDDAFFAAMRDLWADWRNNLASRRDFDLLKLDDMYECAVANAQSPVSEYDVITLNAPWLGSFAESGRVQCLDAHLLNVGIDSLDFDPSVWATGRWASRQYGVPIVSSIELFAARTDLFAEKSLNFPRNFDEVIAAGRKLHAPAEGRFGITWNGVRGMPIASSFMSLVGCCGGAVLEGPRGPASHRAIDWSAAELMPSLQSDAARAALDYMHRLCTISPPNVLDLSWDPSVELFLTGRAAMAYAWSMRAVRFEADVRSRVKRRVRYLPQPAGPRGGNVTPLGGFLLAIPANLPPDRVEAAAAAIGRMTSRESIQSQIDNGFPVLPRFSMAANPDTTAGSPIVRAIDQMARRGQLQAWQRPAVPGYIAVETIIGEEVHDALTGRKSDPAALSDAQHRITAILKRERHLTNVKRS